MRTLSASELLTVWEEGLDQSLSEKTLRLLSRACAVNDYADMGFLSIGERDARLLQLREWMFGYRLMNMASCPACSGVAEWETNTQDLLLQPVPEKPAIRTFLFEQDGYSINFRLPNTHDIVYAMSDEMYRASPGKVLTDCVMAVSYKGEELSSSHLPENILEALARRMEAEDPQADIQMKVECPACKHAWEAGFDIAGFLWAEINNWAQRAMQEVCILARSFGWSEKDILSMSPRRRQLYLQMIGS